MCSAALLNCLSALHPAKRMLIACGSRREGGGEVKRLVGIFVKSLSTDDPAWFRVASEL